MAPTPPAPNPSPSPILRPRACVIRPTRSAANADPRVNNAVGKPARLSDPSICCARRAPTVIPAARPAPPRTWLTTTTIRVRFCTLRRSASSGTVTSAVRASLRDTEVDLLARAPLDDAFIHGLCIDAAFAQPTRRVTCQTAELTPPAVQDNLCAGRDFVEPGFEFSQRDRHGAGGKCPASNSARGGARRRRSCPGGSPPTGRSSVCTTRLPRPCTRRETGAEPDTAAGRRVSQPGTARRRRRPRAGNRSWSAPVVS